MVKKNTQEELGKLVEKFIKGGPLLTEPGKKSRTSEENYQEIINTFPDALLIHDPKTGSIVDGNEKACKLLKYTREELMQISDSLLSFGKPPYTQEEAFKRIRKTFPECSQTFEWLAKDRENKMLWIEVNLKGCLIKGKDRILTAIQDISNHKQTQKALRELDSQCEKLLCHVPGMIYQFKKKPDGTYSVPFSTEGIRNLFGCSPEDVREDFSPIARVILPEDFDRFFDSIEYSAKYMTLWKCEYRAQLPGLPIRWISGQSTPEKLADGSVIWHGFTTDITSRKKAEEALLIANKRLRRFVDSNVIGVVIADAAGKITEANDYYLNLVGFSRDDLQKRKINWRAITPPEYIPLDEKAILEVREKGIAAPYEKEYIRPDGTRVAVLLSDALLPGTEEQIASFALDITERKRIQETLKKERQRFHDVLEVMPMMVCLLTPDYHVAFCNYSFREKFGDPNGRLCYEFCFGKKEPCDFCEAYKVLKTGKPHRWELTTPDDATVIEAYDFPFNDADGSPMILEVDVDITERKRNEQEILLKNKLLEGINKILKDTLQLDSEEEVARTCLSVTQEITGSIFGWIGEVNSSDRLDTIALSDTAFNFCRIDSAHVHPAIKNLEIRGLYGRVVKDGKALITNDPDNHPDWIGLPNGHPALTAFLGVPLNQDGKTIGMIALANKPSGYTLADQESVEALSHAITEALRRKRAAAEILNSRMLLSDAVDIAKIVYWEFDWKTQEFILNDDFYDLYGTTMETEGGYRIKIEDYLQKFVHPDDISLKDRLWKQFLGSPGPEIIGEGEYRVIRRDGKTMHVFVRIRTLKDAEGNISKVFGIKQDITERKKSETALRERENLLKEVFDNIGNGITIYEVVKNGEDFIFKDINPTGACIGKKPREDHIGRSLLELFPGVKESGWVALLQEVWKTGRAKRQSFYHYKYERIEFWLEAYVCKLPSGDLMAVYEDITGRKLAEQQMLSLQAQLQQSQKMEAIGRLAGGVAHDFNNLLTVISVQSQLALRRLQEDDPLKEKIKDIKRAADHAADLTRQLLAFSRRQVLETKVINPNVILRDMGKMLRRVIGEDIEFIAVLPDDIGMVKVDPGQMEQVVINLAVNAKDAMPQGGKLFLETANVELNEEFVRFHLGMIPGAYVMFSMTDTGIGMDKEVMGQIFDPFFTTKEKGKGTGLGLSTVYGIVKQSGGEIDVASEPGKGTTFKIYIPRVFERSSGSTKESEEKLLRGKETILVVEDDSMVRKMAVEILLRQGYRVLKAKAGGEALVICEQEKGRIDLVLTDVVMPDMKGPELIERLRRMRNDFKVLYMTGYTDETVIRNGLMEKTINLLLKPFTLESLAEKIREVLDEN